jgi:coenzyme F420-reducing hydrogenase alpha subunit
MYCGEWIQSHALHIHLLAAPDFLGADSVIALAGMHSDAVRRGLRLQALGNELIELFGGRSVHPVGVCVGGFHRAPDPRVVAALVDKLRAAVPEALALVDWTAGFPLPDDEQDFACVALEDPDRYAMYAGRLASSEGLDIAASEYDAHFTEHQVPHSTALHSLFHGKPYLVGPLARLNLNHQRLPQPVRDALAHTGIAVPSRNMFESIVARSIEIYFAVLEAIRILEAYAPSEMPSAAVTPRAGSGAGATEAPRGLLWHRYETDAEGRIRRARIVPPTSQNQARIEQDLKASLVAFGLQRPDDELRRRGETVIRNYDPCISCATHFLRLSVNRR